MAMNRTNIKQEQEQAGGVIRSGGRMTHQQWHRARAHRAASSPLLPHRHNQLSITAEKHKISDYGEKWKKKKKKKK